MLQGPGSVVKVQETPGVGLYYSEFIYGVPPVMVEHMASFPVVHQVNIFVTNRFCPCPRVLKHERLLIEQLGIRGFYHCICRSLFQPPCMKDSLQPCSSRSFQIRLHKPLLCLDLDAAGHLRLL